MKNRTVKKKIKINAPVNEVWNALTSPEATKEYLFGANVETDWQVGSPITYYGTWEGKEYRDKGKILEIEENKHLRYTHWSSLSGAPDTPEYYYKVTYDLEPKGEDKTVLTVSQAGLLSEDGAEHSAHNWEQVLEQLKQVVERELSHAH
jgi:uncharacterized protein YndB with AHSA1/START domain